MSTTLTRSRSLWVVVVLCYSIGMVATVMAKASIVPDVSIRAPTNNIATNQNSIEVIVDFTASANPTRKARPPTGNVRLVVLTLSGTEVDRFANPPQVKAGTHTFALDISSYPDGIYPLQAFAHQGNPGEDHVGASNTVSLLVDRTPPVIIATVSPQPNANGWHNTDVTVSFSATDNLSGVVEINPEQVQVPREGANQVITASATDAAGNTAATSVTVNLDLTAPTISAQGIPVPNAAGWNNSTVLVKFGCNDTTSGIADCPDAVAVSSEGTGQAINGTATDLAGNSATASITLNLDTTPPSLSADTTPEPNVNGWHNTEVTVSFNASDELSGVTSVSPPVDVQSDGAAQEVRGTATDAADNSTTTSVLINFDQTAPSIAITAPEDDTIIKDSQVEITGTVNDTLSGIDEVTCNGSAATIAASTFTCNLSLEEGANPITAQATDLAGNTSTAQITVTRQTLPTVTITSPANLSFFNISPTTVTGTVDDPTATVRVNAIPAAVVNGSFSVAVPLAEGPNLVTATAMTPAGAAVSHSIQVTLDTTPPRVTITTPRDQYVTTDSAITVAGSVNDIVVGTVNDQQAQVTVNSATAQVANRTFLATEVPLDLGDNVIQAIGSDRVGNAATTQITVTRQSPSQQAQIQLVSGNNQSAVIGSVLAEPLVVALTHAVGNPVANQPVIFKVTRNNGMLLSDGLPAPSVIALTDAQGQAQVQWVLGKHAGAGANASEAYAVGFNGTAMFTATGVPGAAAKIVIDTGNGQIGAVNQPLPRPIIAVVVDSGNNRLTGVPVTFTVAEGSGSVAGQTSTLASGPAAFAVSQEDSSAAGQSSATVTTDADGRAAVIWTLGPQAGYDNNLVEANFLSNQGFPAYFTASGRVPGDAAQTTISGVVLDNRNVPIPGVTVRAVLTNTLNADLSALQSVVAVQTDAQGLFAIPQAPIGFVKLLVDGSTAQLPGEYPILQYDLVTIAGQDNTVGMPIYLLPLNTENQLCVTATTGGGTLTIPEMPGFSLTFGPGQVTFPGGSKTGCVNVTLVHADKVPMTPTFGQQPSLVVTIQPPGMHFDPPAAITLPNLAGLPPREVGEIQSFDHDLGQFVAIGTGSVSEDGTVIQSDPGVGIIKGGWHFCCAPPLLLANISGSPPPPSPCGKCPDCKECDPVTKKCTRNSPVCTNCSLPNGVCDGQGDCSFGPDILPNIPDLEGVIDVEYQTIHTLNGPELDVFFRPDPGGICRGAIRFDLPRLVHTCGQASFGSTVLFEEVTRGLLSTCAFSPTKDQKGPACDVEFNGDLTDSADGTTCQDYYGSEKGLIEINYPDGCDEHINQELFLKAPDGNKYRIDIRRAFIHFERLLNVCKSVDVFSIKIR